MKKLIYGFLLLDVAIFALMLLTGALGAEVNEKVVDFERAIENNQGTLIDIRTPEEFEWERIEGALNIDWKNDNFKKEVSKFDKDETLLFYCRSGARAGRARRMLKKMGYSKIINLGGGILEWKEKGRPTLKSPNYKEGVKSAGEEGC